MDDDTRDTFEGLDANPLHWETARAIRLATGLTAAKFARAIGVGERTINRWEQAAPLPITQRCGGVSRSFMVLLARDTSRMRELTQGADDG